MEHMECTVENLHLPIIIAGISGGGKSTVAAEVEKQPGIRAVVYGGRMTTRSIRPGETDGRDGTFGVSREQFATMSHDLVYSYEKYGDLYGFSRSALHDCLNRGHTFVVGGEPNTALPLKDCINKEIDESSFSAPALRAITIYIRRPINEIIRSIIAREASPEEKLRRIDHIASLEVHEGHDISYPVDYEVLNGKNRLKEAVEEVISIIQFERDKQLKELFGHSFKPSEPLRVPTSTPLPSPYFDIPPSHNGNA